MGITEGNDGVTLDDSLKEYQIMEDTDQPFFHITFLTNYHTRSPFSWYSTRAAFGFSTPNKLFFFTHFSRLIAGLEFFQIKYGTFSDCGIGCTITGLLSRII